MKKLVLLGLVALLALTAFVVVGCGSKDVVDDAEKDANVALHPALANVVKGDGKTLTIATDPTYPPFEFIDENNEIAGFDIDLAKAIADELGAETEFISFEWDALLAALGADSQDFDFGISAMTITEERQQSILFSDPYFVSFQALAVPTDSTITSINDVGQGIKVGVQNGTTGHIFSTKNLEPKGAVIKPYQGGSECFTAMAAGEVDCVVIDVGVAAEYASQAAFNAKSLGAIPGAEQENFGIPFAKSRTELHAAVNEALAKVIENGTYLKIFQQWMGTDPVMP